MVYYKTCIYWKFSNQNDLKNIYFHYGHAVAEHVVYYKHLYSWETVNNLLSIRVNHYYEYLLELILFPVHNTILPKKWFFFLFQLDFMFYLFLDVFRNELPSLNLWFQSERIAVYCLIPHHSSLLILKFPVQIMLLILLILTVFLYSEHSYIL